MKNLALLALLAIVGDSAQAGIIVTQAVSNVSASVTAGSIVVDHSAQGQLNTQNPIQKWSIWENDNVTYTLSGPQPLDEYSSSLEISVEASAGDAQQGATSVAKLLASVRVGVNRDMTLDSICTDEGYVYRVATVDLYIGTLGPSFWGGGSGTASVAFALDVASPEGFLRTYLTEYSVVEGNRVEFNSQNASGGVASVTYGFSMDLDADSPGLAGTRSLDVFAVVPVPEPSTLILGACGLAYAAWAAWRKRRRGGCVRFTATSLTVAATLAVAMPVSGRCFAGMVLTSVNLSGTVTLADAYREQTLGRSVGTGLAGSYAGAYGRVVADGTDTGWVFDWEGGPSEDPWGPGGSSLLAVSLRSVYQSAFPAPGVNEELYGSLSIDLDDTRANSSSPSHIYPQSLSFPEAAPDRSNVRMAASLQVSLLGTVDRAFDANASITLGLESDEPLLRVFMTDEAFQIIYDSSPLDGTMSSPIISQTLTYNSFVGSGIDDFYVYTITPVPEPSTLILGACGLAYAAWGAWRKRRRSGCVKFAHTSLAVAVTLAIALSVSGRCFAGMTLTSVNLSGTVTLGPDAYRDPQTVSRSVGIGLWEVYWAQYVRQVSVDPGPPTTEFDSGWDFGVSEPDSGTFPYSPGGGEGSRLTVFLRSTYLRSGVVPGVNESKEGQIDIQLHNVWAANDYGFPAALPFPEALPDNSNVRRVADLQFSFSSADAGAAGLSTLASFAVQSDEPLLRVFVVAAGNVISYDSGALAGATSSPLISQSLTFAPPPAPGDEQTQLYGVYTITAVPEPSTYAMALAGLACGGYSMWRRRKGHPLAT